MSKIKCAIPKFSEAVKEALTTWDESLWAGINAVAKRTADEAVDKLRTGHSVPQYDTSGKWGQAYTSGWKVKEEPGVLQTNYIVHNAKAPWLTHLLEKGHAMPQGGHSQAYVHIKPVEEEAVRSFEQEVKKVIRNG